ncbi:hypothetical protein D3H55_09925 [Bacillus salacetis]|uniref:Uncharacterized protein n=1 Tax=Bacillus salacetis TaxID=2315464 RepID=A0A3A1QYW0_9BACI|nr:hypothetical protein [Bacillus salacetis]RIW34290.1 hypothetical protein D3H55_09925 [Bacillus salacetis]
MNKNRTYFSVCFLGICILLSSWLIANSLQKDSVAKAHSQDGSRYELVPVNDQNIILFDKQTGEYWRKFIEPNEGPTNWEKQPSPFASENE